MATIADLKALVSKLMTDPVFRTKLFKNPQAAATEAGIKLTKKQKYWLARYKTTVEVSAKKLDGLVDRARGGYIVVNPGGLIPKAPQSKVKKTGAKKSGMK